MKINLKNKIEAVLFLESDPIFIGDLAKRLKIESGECLEVLKTLKQNYIQNNSVLDLAIVGEEVQLVIKKDLAGFAKEYFQEQSKTEKISSAMLEVLSIILYKGPIGKVGIEQIRGVNCGLIIRKLLIKGLISREEQGRGSKIFIYKPSLQLIKKLGISRLKDLPEYDKLSGELSIKNK